MSVRTIGVAVAVLLTVPAILEGVFVAPHAVFMRDGEPAAQVTLGAGDAPEEVSVDLAFGYHDTDSLGTPFLRFVEDPDSTYPSAAAWIRAFPRRMRLEAGDRRTVRLLATPPADLPDGEYWARLIVTSRGASLPVATTDTTVRAGVEIVFRLVVPVTFRKGRVTTGIALSALDASASGDSLVVLADAARLGNGSYLGTARFAVLDTADAVVRDWAIPVAVFYPIHRRFVFGLDGLPPGTYRLALRLATERDDLEADDVMQAPPVTDTVAFVVP